MGVPLKPISKILTVLNNAYSLIQNESSMGRLIFEPGLVGAFTEVISAG